mgnify:FL=1
MTAPIIEEIAKLLPKDAQISETSFEAANIILYTKSKEFFLNQHDIIRNIVGVVKKRIELRPDPSMAMDIEKAEEAIKTIIPAEAGVDNIVFDTSRSVVIIEAEKPGIAIGKQGEVLREIKRQTMWVPLIKRSPALRSQIIENIRAVLYQNSDYRKIFLHKIGLKIYGELSTAVDDKKEEWFA